MAEIFFKTSFFLFIVFACLYSAVVESLKEFAFTGSNQPKATKNLTAW